MKSLTEATLIALSFIAFLGCTDEKNKFIGKWKINAADKNNKDVLRDQAGTWEFDSDGFFLSLVGDDRNRGKWILFKGDSIVLDMLQESDLFGKYEFVDGKLKITGVIDDDAYYIELIKDIK